MYDYSIDEDELDNAISGLDNKNNVQNNALDKYVQMPKNNGFIIVRILPPAPPGAFGREKHSFFSETKLVKINSRNYHCRQIRRNGRWEGECPLVKYYNLLWKKAKEAEADGRIDESNSFVKCAKSIKPVERYYYNAILRDKENGNKGPLILSCGKVLHSIILRAIKGDPSLGEEPLGNITHPLTGRDLRIVVTSSKGNDGRVYPNYTQSKFLDKKSVAGTEEEITEWIKNLHDLKELITWKDPEELKKALKIHFGAARQEEEEEFDFLPQELTKNENSSFVSNSTINQSSVNANSTKIEKVEKTKPKTSNDKPKLGGDVNIDLDDDFELDAESLVDDDFMSEIEKFKVKD